MRQRPEVLNDFQQVYSASVGIEHNTGRKLDESKQVVRFRAPALIDVELQGVRLCKEHFTSGFDFASEG